MQKQLLGLDDSQKKAFMAGVASVVEYINKDIAVMEEDDAIDAFESIQKQCDDYFANHS